MKPETTNLQDYTCDEGEGSDDIALKNTANQILESSKKREIAGHGEVLGFSVPLPPPLAVNNNNVQSSQTPGAYAVVSPGSRMRAANCSPVSVGTSTEREIQENAGSQENPTRPNADNEISALEEGLAEARPVLAPTETAEPVHKESAIEKVGEGSSKCWRAPVALMFLLLVVLIAIITAVTMALQSEDNPIDSNLAPDGSISAPAEAQTPSNNYSAILELMDLPNHTLAILHQAIDNPTASTTVPPQYEALQWIQEDPWLETYSDHRLVQRFALATLYFATGGSNWTNAGGNTVSFPDDAYLNPDTTVAFYATGQGKQEKGTGGLVNITSQEWLSYKTDECQWFSKAKLKGERTCLGNEEDLAFYYNYLDLEGNNLAGTIPPQVGLLTNLQGLFLGHSNLEGTIATEVGMLNNLRDLDLGGGSLTGTIPSEIGLLSDTLQHLVLRQNHLTGSVPSEVWQLSNLHQIMTAKNELRGTFPSDLGTRLPVLNLLMMFSNNLEGSVPPSLGLMTDLYFIDVAENQLTGTLPSQLGKLSNITRLFLANNNFSGSIPSEVALLTGLTKLNVQGNENMSGPFPAELRYLNNTLTTLQLQNTAISGTIPDELCSIKKLNFECSEVLCGCDCPC